MGTMLEKLSTTFSRVRFDVVDAFWSKNPPRVVLECLGDNVVAATGTPYRNHYIMLLRFRENSVIEWREFSNPLFYQQSLTAQS